MRGALGGPRVLLRRLREVMAEPVSAQERLDKVVVLIAANMVAEVCSVYVLRVDNTLELYATEGLKREAVHQTVLRADEGLVGLVASEATPVNLSEAQSHPAFSYRPETGEEIYHSFLGVPVLRAGNMLGVLVVQNRARRTYTEEEEEALQTTAMVLAEMIASGELSALARPGADLKAMCDLGARLRIGTDSVICVSGSACQLGLGLPVGDLDFCEYLPTGDDNVPERLSQKLVERSKQALCFQLDLGEGNIWVGPWRDVGADADMPRMIASLRTVMTTALFRQCKFVACVPSLGVLEATNVLVLLDYAALESSEAGRSFAAQEVPLASNGWIPRDLSSPLALGEYIVWLVRTECVQCDESQAEPRAVVKAARRALSAARLLFLRRETEQLVCLLGNDAARLAALFDRCQLYAAISNSDDEAMQEFTAELLHSIAQIRRSNMLDDSAGCARLTDDETKKLCGIRDIALPVIREVLETLKRKVGLDLNFAEGSTH